MTDEHQFSTDEILVAIGRELKAQTELLRYIQMAAGFLAFLALIGVPAGIALAATP